MSGTNTTSSGTPISDLPLASAVASTDTLLAVVGGGSASAASAQQVSVGVLGSAISIAAGIPDAVTSATQAATQADAAAKKAYDASVQAVQDQAGAAGGVAALDDQARLLLQGRSALMVTPATSGGDGVPGMPTTLSPMLPLNPNTAVGISDVTLGGAIALASGAIQSSCLGSSVAGLSPITVSSGGTAQPVLNGNNVAVTRTSVNSAGIVSSSVTVQEIGGTLDTLYSGVNANNSTIIGLVHGQSHLSSDGTTYSGSVASATLTPVSATETSSISTRAGYKLYAQDFGADGTVEADVPAIRAQSDLTGAF